MKRKDFLKTIIASGIMLSHPLTFLSCNQKANGLDILVLGGTNFVGPAVIKAALATGHKVTLFNRGLTNPQLFPDLEQIKGDRTNGEKVYEPLLNKQWDLVIDVWPEKSTLVEEAARSLANHAGHYIFISSIAVYNNFQEVGLHESSELVIPRPDKSVWGYHEEKLVAEQAVQKAFPNNYTILRPGPIKGWRDPALDLVYWCAKLNREEAIIAPGSGLDPVQFVDVNDVGRFCMLAVEQQLTGAFNITGPMESPLLWKDFLAIMKRHFNSNTELIWASEAFLRENEVYSFSDLPLWAPLSEDKGFMQISNKKMLDSGFELTPLTTTLHDCYRWYETELDKNLTFGTPETELGLNRQRELKLIAQLVVNEGG